MGKSLDGYHEQWENNLKITDTPPDLVEVVKPDQNAFEDHLQARTDKDVEVFEQVCWSQSGSSPAATRSIIKTSTNTQSCHFQIIISANFATLALVSCSTSHHPVLDSPLHWIPLWTCLPCSNPAHSNLSLLVSYHSSKLPRICNQFLPVLQ
ncbi:uncharacterized protein ACWYII_039918 isoform 2-T5 [Salvelinus alpinus]